MNTVRDILEQKGKDVWSIPPETTLIQALQLLRKNNIGALLIMDHDKVEGIITERDFAWKIAEKGTCPLDQPVTQWMTKEVLAVKFKNIDQRMYAIDVAGSHPPYPCL